MSQRLERNAAAVFAVVGLAMVVAAGVGYLADPVSVAFAVLGVGLLLAGGLASRIISLKFTRDGVELVLREVIQKQIEEAREAGDDEQVKALEAIQRDVPYWYEAWHQMVTRDYTPRDPTRAATLMRDHYRATHPKDGPPVS